MSGMDLDSMRGRWQDANRRADAAIRMDADAMRAALAMRTRTAFRRHSGWLLAGLVVGAGLIAVLGAFLLRHGGDWRYALMAGALLVLVAAEFVVDLRQWRALSALDFNGPLLQVRGELDTIRSRRLGMVKWIVLSSVLLWWPALLVAFMALTGVDALRFIAPSVIWVNLAFGLGCIPLGLWLMQWLSKRYSARPGFQRFLRDAAGRSWQQAEDAFAAGERFEQAVASGALAPESEAIVLPEVLRVPLRGLRLRLDAGIALYASLLVATGVFNAMHGGQAGYIVAGVALNLVWVANMVASIVHRRAAARPAPGVTLSAWREGLAAVVAGRLRAARIVAVLLPLLAAPAVQLLSGLALEWVVAAAIALSALLAWRRQRAAGFAAGLADVLALGALSRSRDCLAAGPQ
ncbi:MAG: hypothetical protein ABI588_10830 [Arenimonas sp.]